MKLNMAVVGYGFVGKAVEYGFSTSKVSIQLIDPKLGTSISDISSNKDLVFVCVPTPMGTDGSIDASILKIIVRNLFNNPFTENAIIVIKSTVTPAVLNEIVANDHRNQLVYNPEFLTENNANQDFINPIMHVFGGPKDRCETLHFYYKKYSRCADCSTHFMSITEASLVKYGINSFLASKVLWFNEFFDIVEKSDGNYNTVINAITSDKRIGTSHTSVPGWDGRRGFGGACFTKDVLAFIHYSKDVESNLNVLTEVWNTNIDYRNGYNNLLDREKEQKVLLNKIN